MSCCGKKREAMVQRRAMTVFPKTDVPAAATPRTLMEFKGRPPYLVQGRTTREVYHFTLKEPEQWVDARDAAGLMKTGLFTTKESESAH